MNRTPECRHWGDQGDLWDAGLVAATSFAHQEQCGRGEDGTGGRLSPAEPDGLHHVALRMGVLPEQDADHARKNNYYEMCTSFMPTRRPR